MNITIDTSAILAVCTNEPTKQQLIAQTTAPSVRLVVASKNVENRGQKDMKWHGTQKS